MIKIIVFLSFLFLFSHSALAESFEERVTLGHAVEDMTVYKDYKPFTNKAVGNYMAHVMKTCFENTENPKIDPFVLVMDIDIAGKAISVEALPETNIAICFKAGIASAPFPAPPVYAGRNGFPVVINMKIKP